MIKIKEKALQQAHGKQVFVGLSGGVDSSVAAYLLKKQGYEVIGVHLRCWNLNGCDVREAEDARRVAGHLGIPFYVFNLEKEYKRAVVDYMLDGYRRGLTPNPDVMCNKEIKFGLFLKKASDLGADYIATGHYSRLRRNDEFQNSNFKINLKLKIRNSKFSLWSAKDVNKDQSYFLWTLTQDQLKHILFPLGDYLKSEVRQIAQEAGLPTAEKKDSQGICFVGKVTLPEFLSQYINAEPGRVLTTDGRVVGSHPGVQFYTIGQRQGLGVALNTPHYVAQKDIKTNTVVLAPENDASLYCKEIIVSKINIISGEKNLSGRILARIRYRQPLVPARVEAGRTKDETRIIFNESQKFVAPGQSAVFYSAEGPTFAKTMAGREMLGGAIIT